MKMWMLGFFSSVLVCFGVVSCAGCQTKNPPISQLHDKTQKPKKPAFPAKGGKGSLSFAMIPGHTKLLSNKPNKLNILLRLSGKNMARASRPPLNLGIVVDRSGSMTGEKIASVKVAALELMKQLNQNDKVTLVSYSNGVEVHQHGVPLDSEWSPVLRSQILGIRAGGMTALGPALLDTLGLLETKKNRQDIISHAILLSDGLANVGVTSPEILGRKTGFAFEQGISVSTLGVGLDYNEDLMTHLADQGGGHYYFVQDTQAIATVLNDELKGLESTVARNIEVRISNQNGVNFLKSSGYPARKEADRVVVKVGSMRSGQNRDILLQFQIEPMSQTKIHLGDFEVRFRDATRSDSSILSMTTRVNLETTGDLQETNNSENTEVAVLAAELSGAEELEGAARAVESGDFDSAQEILNSSIDVLEMQARKTPDIKIEQQIQSMQTAIDDLDGAKKNFNSRKAYIKQQKAASYQQKKKAYKKRHQTPRGKNSSRRH